MNRTDRNKLEKNTQLFIHTLTNHCSSFKTFLSGMEQDEEEKLYRLPESLVETETGEQISNSQERLNTAQDSVEAIEEILSEIVDILGVEKTPTVKTRPCKTASYLDVGSRSGNTEKRTERLQFVVTPTIASELKKKSKELGISTNELLCRILLQNGL